MRLRIVLVFRLQRRHKVGCFAAVVREALDHPVWGVGVMCVFPSSLRSRVHLEWRDTHSKILLCVAVSEAHYYHRREIPAGNVVLGTTGGQIDVQIWTELSRSAGTLEQRVCC